MKRIDRIGILVAVLACGAGWATPALAQASAAAEVESDAIRCWWGIDKPAVHMGEQFTLKLTCGVIETSRVKAVPVANQFEPTAMQLAPFEVMGGTRHEDLRSPPWRYFQSEYTLRIVGDRFYLDVDIPSIKITYNLQFPSNAGQQGRDLTYVLPAIPVRILPLVPKGAIDIRDMLPGSFGDVEARGFRSTTEFVVATIAFGFSVILLGFALVNVVGRFRGRVPVAARALPARTMLAGCLRTLHQVKSDVARGGWTEELLGRALAAVRIAGAIALGRPVAQTIVDRSAAQRVGQIVVARGTWRRRQVAISASTTANVLDLSMVPGNGKPSARGDVEELRHVLRTLNAARYSRSGQLDGSALDSTLTRANAAIRRLRVTKFWRAPSTRAPMQSAASV